MSKRSEPPQRPPTDDLEADALARRKLLQITVYAVPAVIGTFSLQAAAQTTCGPHSSCPPNCEPNCEPNCNPNCNPHNH